LFLLAPGDDGRLEDIIIQAVMSSNGHVEALASLLAFERPSCRIQSQYDHFVLRSPRHDALFSTANPSLFRCPLIQLTHGPSFREKVVTPSRKIVPVRPLINSTRSIDTFDSSVCHDEPRATSNQYPKKPIHRATLVTGTLLSSIRNFATTLHYRFCLSG